MPEHICDQRILIAALDWGMGHTTRCVAVIKQLMAQNNMVFFAGNEQQTRFMRREFDGLKTLDLEGYGVQLDARKSTYWQMFVQLGKIKRTIKREQLFVANTVQELKIDVVISDNRYGFFSTVVPSVFICHQLRLKLPFMAGLVNRRLKGWIERFQCIWIPDRANNPLCGDLLLARFKIPAHFIGLLCRFKPVSAERQYDLIGIVSGPEPERSRFARQLETYLIRQKQSAALVGHAGNVKGITYFLDPTTDELGALLAAGGLIVSRAGYTTIMEMTVLQKKAVLIPTPGQFEQQYLASTIQQGQLRFVSEAEFLTETAAE